MFKSLITFAFCGLTMPMSAQNASYSINGNDTTCQIFVYCPNERDGLHIAYYDDNETWIDMGKVVSSDYGPWGAEKRMFKPFVTHANDGTWRAMWGVNNSSPLFAVAYSEDLVNWRPQDYPIVREKGVSEPVAFQMDDGTWDVYIKTSEGKRYLKASEDFRRFEEDNLPASADDVLWMKSKEIVGGKEYEGNTFEVPAIHLNYIYNWLTSIAEEGREDAAASKMNPTVTAPLELTLDIDYSRQKKISDKLIGVFFEDISYAADGGIWAEMTQNGDFEYSGEDRKRSFSPVTSWKQLTGNSKFVVSEATTLPKEAVSVESPLSDNNPHYVIVSSSAIMNEGWDGYHFEAGASYVFSFFAKTLEGNSKNFRIAVLSDTGKELTKAKIVCEGNLWKKYEAVLSLEKIKEADMSLLKNAKLVIIPLKDNKAAIDVVSLMPKDTYKGHGLRKDLAETIAALQPRFVRFPGGCMTHGDGIDNIYHWKETIGEVQERKPAPNIWHYHQTRKLGFYEFFQWCEDMGAEPLPVLSAGVPCQNSNANKYGIAGQQGGIPMNEMGTYIQDLFDLIEWANGDASTSKWAKERAKAGHPQPFNLKMIGIGNEDLISTDFEDRYLMISKAIKSKYPDIDVVGTVGPFHYPSSDYIEGWKIAKSAKTNSGKYVFSSVDEHYYEQPGWFVNHQDYYDDYDRNAPKVYLGEWAARGKNHKDNALAEALYLCSLERNADVVEMTSYAPLLCKEGYSNWNPDMIYFNRDTVKTTPSYEVQKMFSTHSGDIYVSSSINISPELSKWVGTSVVKDTKKNVTWVKVVNALPQKIKLKVGGRVYDVPAKSWNVFSL